MKKNYFTSFAMLAVFLLIFSIAHAQSITFAPPITNPFGLPITTYVQGVKFADWDGDKDLDLMISEIWGSTCPFHYYENIGTPTELELASPIVNPFGLVSTSGYAFQAIADLDADGDNDLLVGIGAGNFSFFENIGSDTVPQFTSPVTNPFGLTSTSVTAIVDFVDLDGDEDFDLMVGEDDGVMQYFENIGSNTVPNFASPLANPFGYVPSPTDHSSGFSFADLDKDGDYDMLICVGGQVTTEYFENIGTPFIPQFTDQIINPFGFALTGNWAVPDFADLDADGDMDVFFGYQSESQYYENNSLVVMASADPEEVCEGESTQLNGTAADGTGTYTYSWTSDPAGFTSTEQNPMATPTETTNYILEVNDGLGSMYDTVTVVMLPLPDVTFEPLDTVCVQSSAFELTGGDPAGGTYSGLGVEDGWFDPAVAGVGTHVITYTYQDTASCENSAEQDIVVDVGTGIHLPDEMSIGIYPNPVMDILYFEAEEQVDRIEIFSISGKLVRVFENPKNQILINDINSGLYVLRIISMDGDFAVRKLQKH